MKKYLIQLAQKSWMFIFSILLVCTANQAHAEIGIQKVVSPTPSKEAVVDGSKNFLGENVRGYIGQELYLKGKSESLRSFGYEGFTTDYNDSSFDDRSVIYNCCGELTNSSYEKMVGKYFIVLDVIHDPRANRPYSSVYKSIYFLKLQDKISKDILYYKYDARFKYSFPFLMVKFFDKQKKLLVGTKYVIHRNWIDRSDTMLDVNTGKPVDFKTGLVWKCKDLTIDGKYYNLSLLLENKKGEQLLLGIDFLDGVINVFTKIEADTYRKRFGTKNWSLILQRKVRIGMTAEMARLSWGKPESINRTITGGSVREQWVYESESYLYVTDGKVSSMQD